MLSDAHIHLENRPYTKAAFEEFVNQAVLMNLGEIGLVEHSHRFMEFLPLYQDSKAIGGKVTAWYENKNKLAIKDYIDFIAEMKAIEWPIKINFGLEVCYFPDKEDFIYEQIRSYPFDFYIGSVHHVDNVPYDLDGISQAALWDVQGTDEVYRKYYQLVEKLIDFGEFEIVGHLDTIKIFNRYPSYDLKATYEQIAKKINEQLIVAENNSGVYYRYNNKDLGLNETLLDILKHYRVKLCESSDAHHPSDVGKYIKELFAKNNSNFT